MVYRFGWHAFNTILYRLFPTKDPSLQTTVAAATTPRIDSAADLPRHAQTFAHAQDQPPPGPAKAAPLATDNRSRVVAEPLLWFIIPESDHERARAHTQLEHDLHPGSYAYIGQLCVDEEPAVAQRGERPGRPICRGTTSSLRKFYF